MYKSHKNHNWYKNLQGSRANKCIWSKEKDLNYIDEDIDGSELTEVCSGLHFEVALVFTYCFSFYLHSKGLQVPNRQRQFAHHRQPEEDVDEGTSPKH